MLRNSKRFETSLHVFIFLLIAATVLFSAFSYISVRTHVNIISGAIGLLKNALSEGLAQTISLTQASLSKVYDIVFIEIIILAGGVVASLLAINYLINVYFSATRKSLIDELTGIYNRRALYKILDQEIKRAERFKHPLSIAIFDIDYFKHYNDNNGHIAGDMLLKRMSQIIGKKVREVDTFGRYGGEEFLIILPETPHDSASKVAERIRKAVETTHFAGEEKQPKGNVTISMGLVTFHGEYKSGRHLVDSADELLYQAKESGRNKVVRAYYKGLDESNLSSK